MTWQWSNSWIMEGISTFRPTRCVFCGKTKKNRCEFRTTRSAFRQDFMIIPFQAVEVYLDNVVPADSEWRTTRSTAERTNERTSAFRSGRIYCRNHWNSERHVIGFVIQSDGDWLSLWQYTIHSIDSLLWTGASESFFPSFRLQAFISFQPRAINSDIQKMIQQLSPNTSSSPTKNVSQNSTSDVSTLSSTSEH